MADRRRTARIRDLLIAMAVLLAPVLLASWWFTRIPEPTVRPVDWQPIAAQAAREAPYPLAIPQNLPASWTAVRARWTAKGRPGLNDRPAAGDTWQLGFLTPEQRYLALDQRNAATEDLLAQASRQGRPDGDSTLGARRWQRLVSADDRTRALVITDALSTVVISGDLTYAELEAFATTLGWEQPREK